MSYVFSDTSAGRLSTCHRRIRRVMERAISTSPVDFAIVCGQRGEVDQNKAFDDGKSGVRYPGSMHNVFPYSLAVDIAPYVAGRGLVWDDDELWDLLADHIFKIARSEGIRLKWGGHFPATSTRAFGWDKPHWELIVG